MKRVLVNKNGIIYNIIECIDNKQVPESFEYFEWNKIGDQYTTISDKLISLGKDFSVKLDSSNESITNLELALCEQYENSDKQLTDLQMALCEIYEQSTGGTTNG